MNLSICQTCNNEPAIYGDGLTWARGAKCEAEFRAKNQVAEPENQAPVVGDGQPHPRIQGLVSIVIPVYMTNYSLFHMTGHCIGTVREHTSEAWDYELIVVDNGSPVQPPSLDAYYADKVIQNTENRGYTKAMNQGIRVSFGEYVVLLSNDVQVYEGWLQGLIDALNGGLDLVMAHPMYSLTEPFARGVESGQFLNGSKKFDDIPGGKDFSCVAFKKTLIDEIGLFDEQFFNYCSDTDFLKRMEKAGKKYAISDKVATHHVASGTGFHLEKTPEIMNEDKEKFRLKWEGS